MSDSFAAFRARHAACFAAYDPPPRAGDPGVITIDGDLDTSTSDDFLSAATSALRSLPTGSALELRMAGVSYVSSTGVGALARLLAEAEGKRVKMRIRGLSRPCREVFSALGLLRYFTVEDEP